MMNKQGMGRTHNYRWGPGMWKQPPHHRDRCYWGDPLKWYQHQGARYIYNGYRRLKPKGDPATHNKRPWGVVLNLGVGTGKTRTALEALTLLIESCESALVVCPKAVMNLW
jgi:hypothetical protein